MRSDDHPKLGGFVRIFGSWLVGRLLDVCDIGKGKFSTVSRGFRKSDQFPVAIKNIHGFGSLSEKKREKTLKEVALLAKVAHPNIIKCVC